MDLKELINTIDSPIPLDLNKRKHWTYEFQKGDKSLKDTLKRHSKKEKPGLQKKKGKVRKFPKLIFIIVLTLFFSVVGILFILQAFGESKARPAVFEVFYSASMKNAFVVASLFIGIASILFAIATIIMQYPTSQEYWLECLQHRKSDNYILEEPEEFYFKSLDYDWDLYRLFSVDSKVILYGVSVGLLLLGLGFYVILGEINEFLIDQDTYMTQFNLLKFVVIISFGFFLILGISIFLLMALEIIKDIYYYNYFKLYLLKTIDEKIQQVDSFISKETLVSALSELEYIRIVLLQIKLNRVRDDARRLPSLPFSHQNIILYSFTGLSILYSITSILLDQFLTLFL